MKLPPVRRRTRARAAKTTPKDLQPTDDTSPVEEYRGPVALEETSYATPDSSSAIPTTRNGLSNLVLAVVLVLFLLAQVLELRQNAESLGWQSLNLGRQIDSLSSARNNASALVQQRQTLVEQSQRVSTSYNELLNDLIKLAETDKDARSVVEKFNIKSAGTAKPETPPAFPK